MSLAGDTSEYISLLEGKLTFGLPEETKKIESEIKKLRERLNEIEKEENDISLELEYFKKTGNGKTEKKSVFDIPHVVWTEIANFIATKNALYNFCLASQELEQRMRKNSCKNKMGLIGEKVFWILSEIFYLSGDDLLNCLNSGDEDLHEFSGATLLRRSMTKRKMINEPDITNIIYFASAEDVQQFLRNNTEENKNPWEIIKDKKFYVFGSQSVAANDKAELWNALSKFMSRFGKYIGDITFRNMLPHWLDKNLMENFPALGELSWNYNAMSSIINGRTCEPNYSIWNEISGNDFVPFLQLFGQKCHRWHLRINTLKYVAEREFSQYSENLKELVLCIPNIQHGQAGYKTFLNTDFGNFRNVETLFIHSEADHLRSMTLVSKFPNLKEITLDGAQENVTADVDALQPGPGQVFNAVRKLTLGVGATPPPPLELFAQFCPCLVSLRLRHCDEANHLVNILRKWNVSGQFANHEIDIFRLYGENRSLTESNIWRTWPILKQFKVMSRLNFNQWAAVTEDREMNDIRASWSEVYTRKQDGFINLQKFVSPYLSDYL